MLKFNPSELAALNARLQEVAEKLGKKTVRSAARKGMTPVREAVKQGAAAIDNEASPEDIERNVAMTTRWKANDLYVRVGIRGGARKDPGDENNKGGATWHWRFVEFGSKNTPARPFMAPALESNAQDVLDTVTAELKKALKL